jgi:hypothetical protein
MSYSYNPIPPRVWSRVQNPCTYIIPGSQYTQAYIPLTGQNVSQAQADYETKQIYKGNILQYKGNSARFTKSQKYSQLARMAGPNRTKVFATQSETYTNPNTTGLLRVGFSTFPFPNQIIGAPNNISGPFAYGIPNPNGCSGNSIQDGGTLVCGTFANPCNGEIIKKCNTSATICAPASASNVPGASILCWNNKVQTWFPRQRYVMNNSGDKWPINYKGFVSAVKPGIPCAPVLYLNYYTQNIENNIDENNENIKTKNVFSTIVSTNYDIHLYWKTDYKFQVDSFNIYINNNLHENIKNNNNKIHHIKNYKNNNCIISITSILNNIESDMSNYIFFKHELPPEEENELPPEEEIDPSNCCSDSSNCCYDSSNCHYDCSNVNNLLIIIDEKINNINSNINNKMNDINSNIEELTLDTKTNFSLLEQNINIKTDNINNTLNIITNSITDVINVTSSIFEKVLLFKNCCCDSSCNCDFYNALFSSSVITKINNYVSTYIETIHQDTTTYIPIDVFDNLNIELISLENLFVSDPSCCFLNMIDVYRNMLKIVKTAYDYKNFAKSTLINSETWKNDSEILNNRDKLNEYIQNLSKNVFISSIDITSIYANLKPQYQIYIQLYGLPENLDFDTTKLDYIFKQLGNY